MSNGSGDYVIAFSTAESVRRRAGGPTRSEAHLTNDALTPLFQAVAEATEEAIYNSMLKAVTTSYGTNTVEALPIDRVVEVLRKYGVR
jgi:D-aminopeptidase